MKKSIAIIALLLSACAFPAQPQNMDSSSSATVSSRGRTTEGDDTPITGTGSYQANERLLPSGMVEIGNANAPISLVVVTNYGCAYCKEFQSTLINHVITDYVRSDKVRISILPFALQKYTDSEKTAGTLLCAGQLSKGWPMHQVLFAEKMNSKPYNDMLTILQMDRAQLEACAASDNIRATIAAQQSVAKSLGVSVVPSYFINGQRFTGLPEYADLRGQIEEVMTQN